MFYISEEKNLTKKLHKSVTLFSLARLALIETDFEIKSCLTVNVP